MGKKLFSFLLTEEHIERLKAVSSATMIPLSALARRGIDLVLGEYEENPGAPGKRREVKPAVRAKPSRSRRQKGGGL